MLIRPFLSCSRPAIRRQERARPRRFAARRRIARRGAGLDRGGRDAEARCRRRAAAPAPRSCVAITTLTPRARDGADDVLDRLGGGGIEARGRLVEKQHLRIARERARQRQPLLLAAGQPPRRPVGRGRRGRPARAIRRCARARSRAARRRRAARSGRWRRRCAAAWPGAGTRWRAASAATLSRPPQVTRPRERRDQAHRDAQQRGLAGAVRADQHGRRARRERRARCGRGSSTAPRDDADVVEHDRQIGGGRAHGSSRVAVRRRGARPRRAR